MRLYSTALKHGQTAVEIDPKIVPTRDKFVFDMSVGGVAFPAVFFEADFLYTEPSWLAGFKQVNGKDKEAYARFCVNLNRLACALRRQGKPSFILIDKYAGKFLIGADKVCDGAIEFDGRKWSDATCYVYGNVELEKYTSDVILAEMARRGYKTALDVCCGFGRAFDGFPRLIASDVQWACVNATIKHRQEIGDLS